MLQLVAMKERVFIPCLKDRSQDCPGNCKLHGTAQFSQYILRELYGDKIKELTDNEIEEIEDFTKEQLKLFKIDDECKNFDNDE